MSSIVRSSRSRTAGFMGEGRCGEGCDGTVSLTDSPVRRCLVARCTVLLARRRSGVHAAPGDGPPRYPRETMPYFDHEGQRIAYTVYGDGPRATVLLPGLLLSQRMQEPLAETLAAHGERVIVMDP